MSADNYVKLGYYDNKYKWIELFASHEYSDDDILARFNNAPGFDNVLAAKYNAIETLQIIEYGIEIEDYVLAKLPVASDK